MFTSSTGCRCWYSPLRWPMSSSAAVGDHLVRVHVGRGARAALDHVDDELLEQRAVAHLLARLGDRARLVVREQSELVVGERRGLLDARERRDEIGIDRDRRAGDRKVLERAQRVDAVVGARPAPRARRADRARGDKGRRSCWIGRENGLRLTGYYAPARPRGSTTSAEASARPLLDKPRPSARLSDA